MPRQRKQWGYSLSGVLNKLFFSPINKIVLAYMAGAHERQSFPILSHVHQDSQVTGHILCYH